MCGSELLQACEGALEVTISLEPGTIDGLCQKQDSTVRYQDDRNLVLST